MDKLRKFAKAINRTSRNDLAPIRVKEIFRLEDIETIISKYVKSCNFKCENIVRVLHCGINHTVIKQSLAVHVNTLNNRMTKQTINK